MTILQILFYCFIAVAVIQAIYYFSFLKLFGFAKPNANKPNNIPLSVIICAKNEAENITKHLPKILAQDYFNFEIVLINDNSSDDTLEIFESFKAKHNNISIIDVKPIEQFWGNKKYALTLGIKAAKNEFLVFTDADCEPTSNQWLKAMSSNFSNTKSIVLGFGGYKKVKYSLLNALIRFETLLTAVQYFSYAKAGNAYMGIGRNLAYRKTLFFNNGGFMKHMSLKSGDDDLFINAAADKNNTTICFTKDSFTQSAPKTTFKDWFIQKRRHISTAKNYKASHQFLLGLFYFSQITFWILAPLLLCFFFNWVVVVSMIAFRIMLQMVTIGLSAKKLDEKDLIIWLPLLEIFLIIFQLVIFSANLVSKPKHWK